jgi:hypothetical protein
MSTCHRELSHRLWCALAFHRRCPLLCCRSSLLQPGCPRQELDDEVSSRLPHAAPSHPLVAGQQLWVIPSPHLCYAVAFPLLCCAIASRSRCLRQELDSDVSRSASAFSFLADTACGLSSLQLPSPTPRRHHALARLCVSRGRINSPPCPAHLLTNGVRTNALHVASTQGRYHCDVTTMPCCTREHARSATTLSRHLPLSLLAQARVAPTQCAVIKGISPVHFVHASGFTVRRFRSTRSPRSSSRRRDRLLRPPRSSSRRRDRLLRHLGTAPEGMTDFSAHLGAASGGVTGFSVHLGVAPRGVVGAPDHLRAAFEGVTDFPDHQSHPAPAPRTGELCPPPSPAFLALSWSSRPCQAGSPCTLGAHGEDLAVVRAVAARR